MILDSMSHEEKSKYLNKVREKISRISDSIVFRTCKHLKKNEWKFLGFHNITVDDDCYTYLIKVRRLRNNYDVVIFAYVYINRNNGSRYLLGFLPSDDKIIYTYDLHVFERYRERFLQDNSLSINDTIRKFFTRNEAGCYLSVETGAAYIVPDGVLLSYEDLKISSIMVVRYKTFITEAMLKADQADLSPSNPENQTSAETMGDGEERRKLIRDYNSCI